MRIRIGYRLFIGFLLTATAVLALVTLMTRWNFERGFLEYINESELDRLSYLAAKLGEFYEKEGSWTSLEGDNERWLELMAPPGVEGSPATVLGPAPASNTSLVSRDPLAISPRVSVWDAKGNQLFGPPRIDRVLHVQQIFNRGEIVGSLHLNPMEALASELDSRFAEQQTNWIFGTALAALALTAVLTFMFTRQMVSPVAELTRGTHLLTAGRFSERIDVQSSDELGDLASDFNTLAETLERHQNSQQQWIADISHELRTPLAVLRAELQGMEDGLRDFDETSRKTLALEVDRLTDLVNDIYDLSVSDIGALRYRKLPDNVVDALLETIEVFEHRIDDAQLELTLDMPNEPLLAMIDRVRLGQLFTNVLENSVRYTDPGGQIHVTCRRLGKDIQIEFDDSAPGVADEKLPRLFERLYRVDSSRRRSTGGAGLGLAICENIAHGHEGKITAERSKLGGIKIKIVLPAETTVAV